MNSIYVNAKPSVLFRSSYPCQQAIIKQLKCAFEKVAERAATDRSKCEQASLEERQAKDLLHKQTQKMNGLEIDVEHLITAKEKLETSIADYQSRQSDMRKEMDLDAYKISNLETEVAKLKSVIEDKNTKLLSLERKVKLMSDEHSDVQNKLADCTNIKSQLEEKNSRLQTQLDEAQNDLRAAKRCLVEKEQLDAEISRSIDLKKSLNKLREKSQQRELELQANAKILHRERAFFQEMAGNQEKIVKSLSRKLQVAQNEWQTRENHILNHHKLEMQKIKNEKEQEIISLKNNFETESKFSFHSFF